MLLTTTTLPLSITPSSFPPISFLFLLFFSFFKWTTPFSFIPLPLNVLRRLPPPTPTSAHTNHQTPRRRLVLQSKARVGGPRLRHRHRFWLPRIPLHRSPGFLHMLPLRRRSPSQASRRPGIRSPWPEQPERDQHIPAPDYIRGGGRERGALRKRRGGAGFGRD
ncbi:OLC1v1000228C1 [Oldenlandia corymbosa var. corymbosa]|uniref:OLC1v1000228C1 n=1 Tax=Oldenlandia corymbosa var. corymbosa TaxID=529605 RepID=A0AAV1D2F1_OLDCO|nr:OLC1v1000228C1 [Oldenlandia corymbosa var. corymbosa]